MKSSITFCLPIIAALVTPMVKAAAQTERRAGPPVAIEIEMLASYERRAETLQTELLDLLIREIQLQARIDGLNYQMRPDNIQRALQFVGSARPMDEIREDLRRRLESERDRVNQQLELLATTRARVETALADVEKECSRLRKLVRPCAERDQCE